MKHTECEDCKLREGDCGHHFKMDGVTNYDIASLSACDQYGNCYFFKSKAKPKGDLINREALEEVINDLFMTGEYDCNSVLKAIDNAPAVYDNPYSDGREDGYIEGYEAAKRECERPHGEWITGGKDVTGQYFYDEFICNQCFVVVTDKSNFCPKCGADMRKGSAE